MTPRFSDSFLAEVKARTSMVELVGREVELHRRGGDHWGLCPFHAEKTPSFKVDEGGGFYKCHGCGAGGDAFAYVAARTGCDFPAAVEDLAIRAGLQADRDGRTAPKAKPVAERLSGQEQDEARARNTRAAVAMWLNGRERLSGTPAAAYLAGRGIDLARLGRQPRVLRFHEGLRHPETGDRLHPALVAAVCDGAGRHVATHRTFLQTLPSTRIGQPGRVVKLRGVKDPKLSFGPIRGGAIRLWRGQTADPRTGEVKPAPPVGRLKPDAPADDRWVWLTEGIEDALTLALARPSVRIWAAISGGNFAAVELPDQVAGVVIVADNDGDGSQASRAVDRAIAAHRAAGRQVKLCRPPPGFKDANEMVTGETATG